MADLAQHIVRGVALLSLIAIAAPSTAQRGRLGAGGAGQARAAARANMHRAGGYQGHPNRAYAHDIHRNGNRNYNRNVNRNYNRNVNVNVNRNVNVHGVGYWGRPVVVAPRYVWPRGFVYVRRPIGYILPHPFLTAAYFYTGWAALGLAAPHPGYQWVRYGRDLLLVQVATGRVVDVRYGVFAA